MQLVELIIPSEYQDAANRMCIAMGWGDGTFDPAMRALEFSGDGSLPATHLGRATWASQDTIDLLTGEADPPEIDWAEFDLTPTDVGEVLSGLLIQVRSDAKGNFDELLAEHGLKRVMVEEE